MQNRKCIDNIVLLYSCCNQINLNILIDKVYLTSNENLLAPSHPNLLEVIHPPPIIFLKLS